MESSAIRTSINDNEQKALKSLLDSFASVLSLEDIASAYCKAGRDAAVASEILSQMQESSSTYSVHSSSCDAKSEELSSVVKDEESSETSSDDTLYRSSLANRKAISNNQIWVPLSTVSTSSTGKSEESSESSTERLLENSSLANGKSKTKKQRLRPVSVGSVSSVIGRDYMKSKPPSNGSFVAVKPLRLDIKELPQSERYEGMHKDLEDFLFKMLGAGFQLDRAVIRDVLHECGYDMAKSMDGLLNLSEMNSTQQTTYSGNLHQKFVASSPEAGLLSSQDKIQSSNNSRRHLNSYGKESYDNEKDLQKEVLTSLFNASKKYEESPITLRPLRKPVAIGAVVVDPPEDPTIECNNSVTWLQQDSGDDKEDNFQQLRRAVAEYRATMEQYYKAAAIAFGEGNIDRANKLLEKGQFFHKKACEADEESSKMIFETRKVDTSNDLLLDLHNQGVREAVKLLKSHLSSFAGIPSFKNLKIIIEKNGEDDSKGARRRLVRKLLERESIKWAEDEEDAGTIIIHLENINPKRLSFAKK